MIAEQKVELKVKREKSQVFVKCPRCGRWNDMNFNSLLLFPTDGVKGGIDIQNIQHCIGCEEEMVSIIQTRMTGACTYIPIGEKDKIKMQSE